MSDSERLVPRAQRIISSTKKEYYVSVARGTFRGLAPRLGTGGTFEETKRREKRFSVTSIGNYAFSYCLSLTSVEIPNSVTSPWMYFSNIEECEMTDVPVVVADGEDSRTYVYDLNGVYVGTSTETLLPGTYIVRTGRSARKVIVP